jgi:hypothetical protein
MSIQAHRLSDQRYQRAYGFTAEALKILCCGSGSTQARLEKIDREFFSLRIEELPETGALRSTFESLKSLATACAPKYEGQGRIEANLSELHHKRAREIAELVWEIHEQFTAYMLRAETN